MILGGELLSSGFGGDPVGSQQPPEHGDRLVDWQQEQQVGGEAAWRWKSSQWEVGAPRGDFFHERLDFG